MQRKQNMNTEIKQISQDGNEYEIQGQLFENTNEFRTSVFCKGEIIYDTISPISPDGADGGGTDRGKTRKDVMFEFLENRIRAGRIYL
jgi:hypothetical protein